MGGGDVGSDTLSNIEYLIGSNNGADTVYNFQNNYWLAGNGGVDTLNFSTLTNVALARAVNYESAGTVEFESAAHVIACQERIRAARAKLGKRAVILGHHYQRADVYQHADLTGDSLKLSKLASQTDSEYVIFCGVHFMAEVADIMTAPNQIAILPDLAAGCSMADMANLAKVARCWRELSQVLNAEEEITPVTYINSAADLKAFCGEHVLTDVGNIAAQIAHRQALQIVAIKQNGTGVRIVETRHQRRQRRLAAAGLPDQRHRLAGWNIQGNM